MWLQFEGFKTNSNSCRNIVIPIENKSTNTIWVGCTPPIVRHIENGQISRGKIFIRKCILHYIFIPANKNAIPYKPLT